jgi:YihY family inner membrane protein
MARRDAKPLQAFFQKFNNDGSFIFAGSLAYSLLTALFPIIIALVAILGFALGSNQNSQEFVLSRIQQAIPSFAAQGSQHDLFLSVSKQLNASAGILAIISVLLAIFGGSRLFIAVENCLDLIYRVRPRTTLSQNAVAIAMVIIFIVLIPIMVLASTIPSFVLNFINANPSVKNIPFFLTLSDNVVTFYLAGLLGGLGAAFLLFEAIYFIVPNQHISWRHSWCGALVASIALEIFIILFPFYTSHFMGNYVGQIAFAIVLLVFFYYFASILILGAEVNAFFFEGVRPLPNDLTTFVSTLGATLIHDHSAAESHKHSNAQKTEAATNSFISSQLEKNQQNKQEPHKTVLAAAKHEKATTQPSKLPTIVGVVTGSALALLIETLRLRQQKK